MHNQHRINELIEKKRMELNMLSMNAQLCSKPVLRRSRQLDRLLNILDKSKKEQASLA